MSALLSSQIEGTQSSLPDLLLFELEEAPGVPFDGGDGSLFRLAAHLLVSLARAHADSDGDKPIATISSVGLLLLVSPPVLDVSSQLLVCQAQPLPGLERRPAAAEGLGTGKRTPLWPR